MHKHAPTIIYTFDFSMKFHFLKFLQPCKKLLLLNDGCRFLPVCIHILQITVVSRYLEIEGTFKNTSRYPFFDISDL